MKEKVLLTDWKMAGLSKLSWYLFYHNYEGLLCYLLFFFLDYDAISHRIVLRSDCSNLIDRFITCEAYDKFICKKIQYDYGYGIKKFKTIIQDF